MFRNYSFVLVVFFVVVCITAAVVSSCGGHGKSLLQSSLRESLQTSRNDTASVTPVINKGTFKLEPQGGLTLDPFDMSLNTQSDGSVTVEIAAANAESLQYALFNLKYDAQRFTPTTIDFGDFFGDDVLTTGITTIIGNVGLAVVPIHYDEKQPVSGNGLIATVRFENEPNRTASRGEPPDSYREKDVFEMTPIDDGLGNTIGARWPYLLIGDGDISGEIGVPDITPIANDFLTLTEDVPELDSVDYNGDGEINIADITVIANNYMKTILGYNIYVSPTDTFDKETAVLDCRTTFWPQMENPIYSQKGFLLFSHNFYQLPTEGDTWYYFVAPYSVVDWTEIECGTNMVSKAMPVEGHMLVANQPRLDSFNMRITGDGIDLPTVSRFQEYDLEASANETYTFTLESVNMSFWNTIEKRYDPPVIIDRESVYWDDEWTDAIGVTITRRSAYHNYYELDYTADEPVPGTYVITFKSDDPFAYTLDFTLFDCAIDNTTSIKADIGIDSKAPYIKAVDPHFVHVQDLSSTTHSLYLNMNDQSEGTEPYSFRMDLVFDDTEKLQYSLSSTTNPDSLTQGEFMVEEQYNAEYDTTHILHFRAYPQVGIYRMFVTNNIGRMNSINHPPEDGSSPNKLYFGVKESEGELKTMRSNPDTITGINPHLTVMLENPKVQKYPGVYAKLNPFADKYGHYIRSEGDVLLPDLDGSSETGFVQIAPFARVYAENPFDEATGWFDPVLEPIASTLAEDRSRNRDLWGFNVVNGFDSSDWGRVVIDMSDDNDFPPLTDPDAYYHIVVFDRSSDWHDPNPVGYAKVRKITDSTPFSANPEVVALANADLVFDEDGDGFAPQESDWPIIRYPNAQGVTFDWLNFDKRDTYTLFILANDIRPDIYYDDPYSEARFRDTSIVLYADPDGEEMLSRTVPNQSVDSKVLVETVKPYIPDTNPDGYTPPALPKPGDPAVIYDNNDTGWIVCPLAEIDQFEALASMYQTFYVGVGVWNPEAKEWIDSPPLDVPFTVKNYS